MAGGADKTQLGGAIYAQDVGVDRSGNLYVLTNNDRILDVIEVGFVLKIDPAGNISRMAGSAQEKGAEDGDGVDARFSYPQGLAVNGEGHIFVADSRAGFSF